MESNENDHDIRFCYPDAVRLILTLFCYQIAVKLKPKDIIVRLYSKVLIDAREKSELDTIAENKGIIKCSDKLLLIFLDKKDETLQGFIRVLEEKQKPVFDFLQGKVNDLLERKRVPPPPQGIWNIKQPLKILDITNGKCNINRDVIEYMNTNQYKVAVVAVTGRKQTGKTFLLNCLGEPVMKFDQKCSRGIWMQTCKHPYDDDIIWIGLDLVCEDAEMPELLKLCKSISSTFLFNTKVVENAYDDVNKMMLNDRYSTSVRKLVIVRRDTDTEHEERIEVYNRKKLNLFQYFQKVEEHSLCSPIATDDETKVRKQKYLFTLGFRDLSSQFQQGIFNLERGTFEDNTSFSPENTQDCTAAAWIQGVQELSTAFNSTVPLHTVKWKKIQDKTAKGLENSTAIKLFTAFLGERLSRSEVVGSEDFLKFIDTVQKSVLNLCESKNGLIKGTNQHLHEDLEVEKEKAREYNRKSSMSYCNQVLNKSFKDLKQRVVDDVFLNNDTLYETNLSSSSKQYKDTRDKGEMAHKTLSLYFEKLARTNKLTRGQLALTQSNKNEEEFQHKYLQSYMTKELQGLTVLLFENIETVFDKIGKTAARKDWANKQLGKLKDELAACNQIFEENRKEKKWKEEEKRNKEEEEKRKKEKEKRQKEEEEKRQKEEEKRRKEEEEKRRKEEERRRKEEEQDRKRREEEDKRRREEEDEKRRKEEEEKRRQRTFMETVAVGATAGATYGAVAGTVAPGVGNLTGAVAGGIGGAVVGVAAGTVAGVARLFGWR